ncbi:hypothetical protein WR25_25657 [Diploscapter pachys]|uniref:Piezo domain-containing protein n=1 Tax=Diploscapter pachys TaxID=2018661 RepID=A0A2A2KLA2_9BILA|nr:hypothetical protein WR25_25657 [Diploscapter pachys]
MTTPAGMHQSVVSHDSGIDDFPYIDEDDMTLPIIVARPNRRRRRIQRYNDATIRLHKFYCEVVELLWRLADIHISSVVLIIIAVFISNNVCALHLPVMVLLAITLFLPNSLTNILSLFMCVYICLIAILKMIYQLNNIHDWDHFIRNNHSACNATQSFPTWLGVEKNPHTWQLLGSTIVTIVALGLQSAIIYRQRHHRSVHGESEETKHLAFPKFHLEDYDRSFLNSLKFLIDYGFLKFGFEICICLMGISAWVRMDFLAAVQTIWIGIFALNSRSFARWVWPIYVLYMTIILPLQYALYVGFPEETCFGK